MTIRSFISGQENIGPEEECGNVLNARGEL
jgi:hypothetical protein